jgi:hypothetical protein
MSDDIGQGLSVHEVLVTGREGGVSFICELVTVVELSYCIVVSVVVIVRVESNLHELITCMMEF